MTCDSLQPMPRLKEHEVRMTAMLREWMRPILDLTHMSARSTTSGVIP